MDFCADINIYIAAKWKSTIKGLLWMADPSKEYSGSYNYAYAYSWSSAKGWLVMPPFSKDKLVEKAG